MSFFLEDDIVATTNIKVVGAGGGGGNAVNRMVVAGLKGVEFISMNTDAQALSASKATQKVQLGAKLTKGRGAGADPEIGQRAAEESRDEIAAALKGCQMVFITAGMGGGTGTGAAPIIAEVAKEQGILTVGIVTKPFAFEGPRKMRTAQNGISNLLKNVDSLIVIPNDRLKYVSEEKITLVNAFEIADNVLKQGVESISELINVPSFINLDFADVRAVMKDAGYAHMGVGRASGENKASEAAHAAIQSPLLETSISGARGVIISITSSPDIGLEEVEEAATLITSSAHPDANIIWGAAFDPNLVDELKVTVVATGFDDKPEAELVTRKAEPIISAQPVPQEQKAEPTISQEETTNTAKDIVNSGKNFDDETYLDDVIAILRKNSMNNF
ncbi:MAG: cell division protein FtsZ [Oscillospiraceae bacterium]|nr:cell division protein FtsZ [Oscillospiraceae bacterium]